MGGFFIIDGEYTGDLAYDENEPIDLYQELVKKGNVCGTAACAAGHLPFVKGIPKPTEDEQWDDYTQRVTSLGTENETYHEWKWCFDGHWEDVDNSHHGAAKRILFLVEHGRVPEWFDSVYDIMAEDYLEIYRETIAPYPKEC